MKIDFTCESGDKVRYYGVGVSGDRLSRKLDCIVCRYTSGGIDLSECTPYVKFENKKYGFYEKDGEVDVTVTKDKITLTYYLKENVNAYPSVKMQLVFEEISEVDGSGIVVWQSDEKTLVFDKSIASDGVIAAEYPSVIQDLTLKTEENADNIAALEERVNNLAEDSEFLTTVIVEELPEVGESNKVYLIKKDPSGDTDNNVYNEYLYTGGKWELIGDTAIKVEDSYTNATPTTAAIGGIEKGETFDNVSFTDMFTKLLYPYVPPTIVSTSAVPEKGGTKEKGTTATVESVSVTLKRGSEAIVKVELRDNLGAVPIATETSEDFGDGTVTFVINNEFRGNKIFNVKAIDSKGKSEDASVGRFNFVYPYYKGVASPDAEINEALIKSFSKIVQEKRNTSVYYTANNQRMVFASPYEVFKITDPNGFDITSTFTMTRVSITGLDGTAQSYYVYAAKQASTVTEFRVEFLH